MPKRPEQKISAKDIQAAQTLVYMKKLSVKTNSIKHSYYTRSQRSFI